MNDKILKKVIYVDFKTRCRVPVRTGFKVVEHTFDAMAYFWPNYEQFADIAKQKNICRISQLNKLLDSIKDN